MAAAKDADRTLREGRKVPYLLAIPALLFLYLFFIVPLVTLLKTALSVPIERGSSKVEFSWEWSNFSTAFTDFSEQLWRAFAYAGIATAVCLVIAYPLAYFIAFKAGRWRNLLLGLVMVPFFTSFLLRTIAWQSLLADNGPVLKIADSLGIVGLLDFLHISTDGQIMNTSSAVIGGLTYNFLPFMVLPVYVSLEKIPVNLIDAASDLYSSFGRTFRKVIFPLSLPGVFAGTLLTFIPASGDFINAHLLGNAQQPVIGGVIQARFLQVGDYPTASAISLVLMAMITAAVLVYAKFLWTALARSHRAREMTVSTRSRGRTPWGTIVLWIVAIGTLIYLFIPLITIVIFTFNEPTTKFNTTWESFTWDNWLHPFKEQAFTDALIESVKVALVACTLATIIGSLIALALARYRIYGSNTINLLLILPLTTPEIVMGASLFTLFFNVGVTRGFWTIVIAHTMFCLSFVAMTVKARVRGTDWTLEDAAMDLGSSPFRTFWRITMPGIMPGVAAAFLLSLALSIDDYIITSFVAGPTVTFPRRVFDSARIALPPQVHVLATIIMLVAIAIIVGSTVAAFRKESKAK